ncbi:SDR family NAD(P)-dependent oxidoreductase [Mesorhizobium sp. DCY119]|uniref:SDR family NAD(P)-dependent oxidoreductase n=1 Tax=Mesorhizobium sp. DCY119 TaxID=2108445 RepID=UPI000E6D2053|nr:SDR family NAD(P)-dependent oxidoreductase [Mesorhizobium sp. DCY119]RJG46280.1 SDR family oxidoreductase [Mesorhizobium sp. DCY119]
MSISRIFSVEGRKALVTGGASGIGLAVAEALAENGASVTLLDQNEEALRLEVGRLKAAGYAVDGVVGDVSRQDIKGVIASAIDRLGGLDIVFANAGISGGYGAGLDPVVGAIENLDPEIWHRTLAVNLGGVVSTLQAVTPVLKAQRSGKIVVTSSIAGLRANISIGYAYTASKSAVALLTKALALELAPFGVQVNGLAPGPFKTNINERRFHIPENEAAQAAKVPLGRLAQPDEIKGLALLLSSSASSYITGAVIPIDGGVTAGV